MIATIRKVMMMMTMVIMLANWMTWTAMMARKVMIRMVGSQVDNDLVRSVYALERFRAQQYRGGFPI